MPSASSSSSSISVAFGTSGSRRVLRGVERRVGNGRRSEGESQARAHRGEPSRDRGRSEPVASAPELGDPVREHARVHVSEVKAALAEPRGERAQVDRVGAACRLREAAVLEKAVDRDARLHTNGVRRAARVACPQALLSACRAAASIRTAPSWSRPSGPPIRPCARPTSAGSCASSGRTRRGSGSCAGSSSSRPRSA